MPGRRRRTLRASTRSCTARGRAPFGRPAGRLPLRSSALTNSIRFCSWLTSGYFARNARHGAPRRNGRTPSGSLFCEPPPSFADVRAALRRAAPTSSSRRTTTRAGRRGPRDRQWLHGRRASTISVSPSRSSPKNDSEPPFLVDAFVRVGPLAELLAVVGVDEQPVVGAAVADVPMMRSTVL